MAAPAPAQTSWTVQLNSKVLLTATQEDVEKNVVTLKDLKKGSLLVSYRETPDKDWSRTIAVYDVNDAELYKKQERSITLPVTQLKQWAKKGTPIKVYTMLVPLNPAIAVRLRRVHLCTINFK